VKSQKVQCNSHGYFNNQDYDDDMPMTTAAEAVRTTLTAQSAK
jgi:hypothetical protein